MTSVNKRQNGAPDPAGSKQALECLSRAESLRDCVTNEHEDLVGVVTYELCRALNFDPAHGREVADAARLHDIGKFALPSDILHKPGRLSPEEWAFVRKHSEVGHGILQINGSSFLQLAAILALCHHEHYDGSGYPRGISGDRIPFESRIVSVADVYEALRADRAYSRGVDHDTAVSIILDGDGRSTPSQFDPLVLRALEKSSDAIAAWYEEAESALADGRNVPTEVSEE